MMVKAVDYLEEDPVLTAVKTPDGWKVESDEPAAATLPTRARRRIRPSHHKERLDP